MAGGKSAARTRSRGKRPAGGGGDDADGGSSGGSGAASGSKKDASPEVVAISLPWRDNVPGLELGVAMLVNGFMIAGAVMDFSVDTYVAEERDADGLYKKERLEFLLTFLNWRGNAFILSEVMMVLILFTRSPPLAW